MGGKPIVPAKIKDEHTALGYQDTPGMPGRDINNLKITSENGVEYLWINNQRFVDSASALDFSDLGERVAVGGETVWARVGAGDVGRIVYITAPHNGSWFVYDDKSVCIATSLEKHPRASVILPENGMLAFAGEPGAVFTLNY